MGKGLQLRNSVDIDDDIAMYAKETGRAETLLQSGSDIP
jgi:hypothetical protein